MAKIEGIIDGMPFLSELQRQFYITMLAARKERILDFSLNALENKEH